MLTLSIGAVDSIQTFMLPNIYKELNKHSTNIDIHIRTQQSTELYSLLETGEIDIAFGHLEQPNPNMIIKGIINEKMVVICKGDLPVKNGVLDDNSLDTAHQLYIDWNYSSFKSWYHRWLGEREMPTIYFDKLQLIIVLIDNPQKWAIVPLPILQSKEDYNIYNLRNPPPNRVCYQTHHRYPKSSAVESIQILESYIENYLMSMLIKFYN